MNISNQKIFYYSDFISIILVKLFLILSISILYIPNNFITFFYSFILAYFACASIFTSYKFINFNSDSIPNKEFIIDSIKHRIENKSFELYSNILFVIALTLPIFSNLILFELISIFILLNFITEHLLSFLIIKKYKLT